MIRCSEAVVLSILCATLAACGLLGETTRHETVRGRLKFVQTATATRTYGDQKSYSISNGDFRFSGARVWSLGSFVVCNPSPNEAREAFVCQRQKDMRHLVDVVSVVSDRPRAANIYNGDLRSSTDPPEWVGDREGRWLIFDDFLYDVETGEKRPIKGAPGVYEADFRAVSPDAEKVVYQLACSGAAIAPEREELIGGLCADADARKLEVLWLVEVRTGEAEIRKLRRSEHDWLQDHGRFPGGEEWLASFRKQLVWERDRNGRLQLVAPRADTR